MTVLARLLMAAVSVVGVACGGDGGECSVGEPGCPCAAGTCPAGLRCEDDVCVFAGDSNTESDPTSGPTTDNTASATDQIEPGGPMVVELFADASALQEDATIMLTAQVTDPDGLDDVGGGVLVDDATGLVISAFAQISEGTYVANLGWSAAHQANPIEFEGMGSRVYRVEFLDQAQHEGTRTIEIPFDCGGPRLGVCGDGVCRSLNTASDCGGCGAACSSSCEDGVCLAVNLTECLLTEDMPGGCDYVCQQLGFPGCVLLCDGFGRFDFADVESCEAGKTGLATGCGGGGELMFPVFKCCCSAQ